MSFSSLVPLLNVQTRSGSSEVLTPAPSFMPIVVEASSAVSRLHGSSATGGALAPPPAGLALGSSDGDVFGGGVGVATTADGFRVPTETGFGDGTAGLAVAEPPPTEVEQAAIASAVIESSDSERFVRIGIETSVSTIDRRG